MKVGRFVIVGAVLQLAGDVRLTVGPADAGRIASVIIDALTLSPEVVAPEGH